MTENRRLGQVFTPDSVASFMAELLFANPVIAANVLDAGAGAGILTEALLELIGSKLSRGSEIHMVEIDPQLASHLLDFVEHWIQKTEAKLVVHGADFIELASPASSLPTSFTHAILNPPYVKLGALSAESRKLLSYGISVPNLYAAFVWISLDRLEEDGVMVAILPRSFCNGKSFLQLRKRIFLDSRITALHQFRRRDNVFSRDGVLQEVVIIRIKKSKRQEPVHISWSNGDDLVSERAIVDHGRIVDLDDANCVISFPSSPVLANSVVKHKSWNRVISSPFEVSTGPVVDFRNRRNIFDEYVDGSVPLVGSKFLYKEFHDIRADEPVFDGYLKIGPDTKKYVFGPGNYVVIKRISPKEQVPRLRFAILRRSQLSRYEGVAFENHVNVIHVNRRGLNSDQLERLILQLQDPRVEQQFQEISGSTQVNISDLRELRLP